jgi:predicted dienelactone hydrolase
VRGLVPLVAGFLAIAGGVATGQCVTGRESPVGAVTRRFVPEGTYNWRGAATRALVTTVWYPAIAGAAMTAHVVGPPEAPWFRLGDWADDAQPADGHFPLVVLSHGTGGSAHIMSWLARGLASRGYVVASVNHPGNNALEDYTAEGFLIWWERARDLTTVVDMLLKDSSLKSLIDPKRIGGAGFSLGGYTMFEIVGGRTDPGLFQKFCRSAQAQGCSDPPEFPNLFARRAELETASQQFQSAVRQAGSSFRDPRIRGVFAIAPALGPAFVPDSLRDIKVPVAIVAGTEDRVVPVGPNAKRLAALTPRASLTLYAGAGHYTFLAPCTEAGVQAQPQICTDAVDLDRTAIHQRTIDAALHFFEQALR